MRGRVRGCSTCCSTSCSTCWSTCCSLCCSAVVLQHVLQHVLRLETPHVNSEQVGEGGEKEGVSRACSCVEGPTTCVGGGRRGP